MSRTLSQADIRGLYDRLAFTYDFWGKLTESKAHAEAFAMVSVRNGERVLDLGAGTGTMLRRLADANPKGFNVGLDLSLGMLARAPSKLPSDLKSRTLVNGDVARLPFAGHSFDLLFAAFLLDLLPSESYSQVLREWARTVRPDGRLVIVNWSPGLRWYNRGWGLLARLSPKLLGGCRPVDVKPYLQPAGWRIIQTAEISQNTFPSEIILCERTGSA